METATSSVSLRTLGLPSHHAKGYRQLLKRCSDTTKSDRGTATNSETTMSAVTTLRRRREAVK
jgi:hypothetical protein